MPDRVMSTDQSCGATCACSGEQSAFLVSPIDRRKFISLGVYAAAAAALASCAGAGGTDATSPESPTSISATVKVSDFSTLASVGGVAVTSINGSPVAIVRTASSTFITLSRICPHQGSTVNATATGFKCPNHGATFNASGTWTGGERTSSLRAYATSYDSVAGTLTIG